MAFFFITIKILLCLKDIAANLLKIQVQIKNLNLILKKKEGLKEKKQKKQNNKIFFKNHYISRGFLEFSKKKINI